MDEVFCNSKQEGLELPGCQEFYCLLVSLKVIDNNNNNIQYVSSALSLKQLKALSYNRTEQ